MKQSKIMSAYQAIEKIKNKDKEYPLNITYTLFKVKKMLQDQWDFQLEEEKKIFNQFSPEVQENGDYKFESREKAQEFTDKLAELGNMEVDLKITKPKIKLSEQIDLTLGEIEALDEFIEFEE